MTDTVLRAAGLTKRFGNLTAVDNISLDIHAGEVFGLLGPNGAGKTTTIRMLCGLLPSDGGTIHIHNQPVKAGERAAVQQVGVCPQAIVLWKKLTCLEQLEFIGTMYDLPASTARKRAGELLEALGLSEKANVRAKDLSGGMQRRLNLAAALIHDPALVALDEPEAGLDPQSRVLVREFIQRIAREKTVLLTTHNMDEAERVVDRVAIVDHGKLIALGTPDELKAKIGGGDRLELTLEKPDNQTRQRAVTVAKPVCEQVECNGDILTVRALDLLPRIPQILHALQSNNIAIKEFHMRSASLEDVFLALTGRSLRE